MGRPTGACNRTDRSRPIPVFGLHVDVASRSPAVDTVAELDGAGGRVESVDPIARSGIVERLDLPPWFPCNRCGGCPRDHRRPYMEQGRIWFPNAPWRDEWDTELASFPYAKHDDQVDVLSYAA